jgi:CubicO group peptidase (beta-lactamase class C family)
MNNMINRIHKFLLQAVDDRVFPGCVAGIYCKDHSEIIPVGRYTFDSDSTDVCADTIYDVASITKAIPVSCLALKLINDGLMNFDDKLIDYVPEFIGSYREYIHIQHLLTHQLSFDFRLSDSKTLSSDEILKVIYTAKLSAKPGEKFFYANATSILLGLAIERCADNNLENLAQHYFFTPLEMCDTSFRPELIPLERIAPTEIDSWRGRVIRGEIHDESAWALRPKVVGSAGLFSSAPDIINFISMLINGGIFKKQHFYRSDILTLMHTNQLNDISGMQTGSGWELNQNSFMGKFRSDATFGKTGFTGCSIVIDSCKRIGFVLLSNHIYPRRRADRELINNVRSGFADILLENLFI